MPRDSLPILKIPPNSAARSFMPNKPIDLPLEISVLEIPRPLSSTSSLIRESCCFNSTVT